MASRVIVVLGQSLNPSNGTPPATLHSRIEAAARQWKLNSEIILILCGGDTARTGRSEALIMRDLLLPLGVENSSIILEDQSLNTLQNAYYSYPILQDLKAQEIILLSSEFHLPRAKYLFESFFLYMSSLGKPLVKIQSIVPAYTPPPHPTDEGINQLPLERRLAGEKGYFLEYVVQEFLPRHIPNLPIPPLPHARLEQAMQELDFLIERLESRGEKRERQIEEIGTEKQAKSEEEEEEVHLT
jgi:hypothetical protein